MKRLNIKIYGLVQGVFFRHSARIRADELDLKGFVRNESDGSVYIEAEGGEDKLNEFLEWCRHGPPPAQIEKTEFSFEEPSGKFKEFQIK